MARLPQIDLAELQQMLDDRKAGKSKMSQKEMAKYFGVSEAALSQAKNRLKKGVVASSTRSQIQGFIGKKMDAVEQIQKISTVANALLDLYLGMITGDKEEIAKLKAQLINNKVKNEDKLKKEAEEEVEEFLSGKDPHDLAIKVMSEIRGQLSLQLEISKTLYDMKAMQEFQEEVLEEIGKVAPDVRARIVEGLNKRRTLRGAVKRHP